MKKLLGSLLSLLGIRKRKARNRNADAYNGLRSMVLSLKPSELELSVDKTGPVWGLLMDMNLGGGISTLVAIADGTVSLYYSNGGGMLGIGQHDEPRRICMELLKFASNFLDEMTPAIDYPLPENCYTRFYVLTYDGILTVEAKENDLGYNRHALSPLFHKAHELIAQARILDSAQKS